MNPILFLDIDGVLNSVDWAIAKRQQEIAEHRPPTGGVFGIDPAAVVHLQRIVDETNCDIVITSSWRRIHPVHEIRGLLYQAGLLRGDTIGKTPSLYGLKRGHEVDNWISANAKRMLYQTDNGLRHVSYCCLDDDSNFLAYQPLVQTDNQVGLTSTKADAVIIQLK